MGWVYVGSRLANSNRAWLQNEDVDHTGWNKANEFIIAIAIQSDTHLGDTDSFQIQYQDKTDGSGFIALPAAASECIQGTATVLVNGNPVTAAEKGCNALGGFEEENGELEGDNETPAITLSQDGWCEVQCAVDPSGADDGHEYEFRLHIVGDNKDFLALATMTMAPGATTAWFDVATRFKLWIQGFKDIATRFKLTIQAFQDAATRFKLTGQSYQDADTRFKLTVQGYQDVATRFRLNLGYYKDIATRFILKVQAYQDAATRFKLTVQAFQDAATRFKLTVQGYQDAATRFKLTAQAFQDVATRFKLITGTLAWDDISTRFKLTVQSYKDIGTRFKLSAQDYQDIASRFRLTVQGYQDVATRFILKLASYKDIATRFELNAQGYQDASTRFRLISGGKGGREPIIIKMFSGEFI